MKGRLKGRKTESVLLIGSVRRLLCANFCSLALFKICFKLVSAHFWKKKHLKARSPTRLMPLVIPFVQYFGASPLHRGNSWVINICARDHSFEPAAKRTVKRTPMMKYSSRGSSNWKFGNESCNLFYLILFFPRFIPADILTGSVGEQGGTFDAVDVNAAIWSLSDLQLKASSLINNPLKVLFNAVLFHTLPTLFQNAPFLLLLLLCTFFFFFYSSLIS